MTFGMDAVCPKVSSTNGLDGQTNFTEDGKVIRVIALTVSQQVQYEIAKP